VWYMNLHEDKEYFAQVLADTADFMGLQDIGIVEKDYYVTLFLQRISQRLPGVIFKGGTSLSKCHKATARFSEDIDLNVETESAKLSEGQRRRLKADILAIVEELGFTLVNPEQVRSRRDFNRYVIDYQSAVSYPFLRQNLIVETSVFIKSFPNETMNATSYIHDFLLANGAEDEIRKHGLEPFPLKVLSLERTFIDKVFAIADYYLSGQVDTYSRHIYDLYKLYPHITVDDSFRDLIKEVREVRKPHKTCLSAQDDINLTAVLRTIADTGFYKADYEKITRALLFEDVPYAQAAAVLDELLSSGSFS